MTPEFNQSKLHLNSFSYNSSRQLFNNESSQFIDDDKLEINKTNIKQIRNIKLDNKYKKPSSDRE